MTLRKLARGALLILFIGASSFGIVVVFELDDEVQNLQTTEQSDPVWVASQLQFELLRLENTLGEFALGIDTANAVALRFDITWSRINILKQGKLLQLLEEYQLDNDVVTDLETTFQRLEPTIEDLTNNSIAEEKHHQLAEGLLVALDGFDHRLREFSLAIARAKSNAMADFRTGLLSLSQAIAYLGITIASLFGTFIVLLFMDLRSAKKAEIEMRRLAEEASSAAEMKMNFMTVISHELRTPLTSILGGLSLLKRRLDETKKDPTALKLLDVASRNGDRLLGLINDILDAQALSGRKISVERKPVDLNKVVTAAVENCNGYADRFEVSYQVTSPEVAMKALTDETRVTQVLVNLISNATKFTRSGDIVEITMKNVGQRARIEVTDHGMGIPIDRQKAIFAPFYQVNPGTTSAIKGSGLGLSITKQLIELLDGEIGFNSTEGKGSTFWIELDLKV